MPIGADNLPTNRSQYISKLNSIKVYPQHLFPGIAINILGIIFTDFKLSTKLLNHEYIHTIQMKEMLYIFFYIWYVIEWAIKSIKYSSFNKGYLNISFEREAYSNQANLDYHSQRRRFAFIKYCIKSPTARQ